MSQENQKQMASFIGKLFRDHFGKGPESVYVSQHHHFLTIYLQNFISPTEKVLLSQGQTTTIEHTRDILMKSLIPETKAYIKYLTGTEYTHFYYDWSLDNKTGLIAASPLDLDLTEGRSEDYEGKEALEKEIDAMSHVVQKSPESIYSFFLNPRTLVVIRRGILIRIEKELIRQGHQEILALTKRKLEKEYLHNNPRFSSILKAQIMDIFVDWNFLYDYSVIIFILKTH
ncbi:hypothetical protein GCM10011391_04850 [Pullulanibacillus camelliae]|uniref:Na+-translocating membrane potential-generating system MpsC domain-containing protein n=1 Tax=Pullulanibacillus camelliae TaxID=1707096 RepID=A0A8J2YFC8_9BACL|nr:Na-translocating system protein MpsC family protein [Pullulanibacillus camelliae]GGE29342.1 hypothetical protein GCM10011391_04850 [Pullulanibacillus camelliae]